MCCRNSLFCFSVSRVRTRAREISRFPLRAHARARNDMIPYSRYDVVQEREICQGAFSSYDSFTVQYSLKNVTHVYLYKLSFCNFACVKGLIVKNTGSWYIVRTASGEEIPCKIKGTFRLKGFRCTNPVAVGDHVEIDRRPDNTAFITKIDERKNYIIRRASNLSKEFQILAANLDLAVLVVTLVNPETSTTFIDRFLATAEAYNVDTLIAINKIDLLVDDDSRALLEAVAYLYASIGYDVIKMSTVTGEGLQELARALTGKMSLLSGNSGVGKSSIINKLVPGARLRVGTISDVHHTGMHTTTFSEMLDLPAGGAIIDTPGVKGFGTIDFEKGEVAHYFPEIFKMSSQCRYNNCTHTHEPGCAVLEAVSDHRIAQSRYASYLSIIDDSTEGKYRKPY